MTNFEKIKNMSVEEMAEFLFNQLNNDCIENFKCLQQKLTRCNGKCNNNIINWLKSEVEE